MKVTFMIGNGFDLNLGLKTRYTHFLENYHLIQPDDSEGIRAFKTDLKRDEATWADAELAFGMYTAECKKKGYKGEDFCTFHEHFCDELARYLRAEECRITPQDLKSDFVESLKPEAVLHGLRQLPREQIAGQIDASLIYYEWEMSFINFNYTSVIDSMVEKGETVDRGIFQSRTYCMDVADMLHIHGTTEENMILGVNDESQIADPSLFSGDPPENKGSMIKPWCNGIIESGAEARAKSILDDSDLVYIYGMSLGETDKLWWQYLCSRMALSENLHTIVYGYGLPERSVHVRSRLIHERMLKQKLLAYGDEADAAKFQDRIHVVTHNLFLNLYDVANRKATA